MTEETGEELVNLAPMRVRRDSVESTIADCKFFISLLVLRVIQKDIIFDSVVFKVIMLVT